MASIKYSGLITEIKGKIGGTVFKATKQGFAVQNTPNKAGIRRNIMAGPIQNPNKLKTTFGGKGQIQLAYIAGWWRNLSEEQRNAWNLAAPSFPRSNKFGVVYTPTGYNIFMEFGLNLLSVGDNLVSDPPLVITVDPPVVNNLYQEVDGTVHLDRTVPVASTIKWQVWATNEIGAGRSPNTAQFKLLGWLASSDGNDVNLDSWYQGVWNKLPRNPSIYMRFIAVDTNTGIKSVPVTTFVSFS